MWRKLSLARVGLDRGFGPVHLKADSLSRIGVKKAFDQREPLSFVSRGADFAEGILPEIIGISSETWRRCRYVREFTPNSVKVEIQIIV